MTPRACGSRAADVLGQAGAAARVAVVEGDDLLPRLDELMGKGHLFTNLDTGAPLETVRDRVVSANAYLGSRPIVEALRQGADVVVTGRVADACLTVGPAVHEHGWGWADWDRLAAATAAGHLIECGAQLTGGLWTHWEDLHDLANVGYPIASIRADGSFRVETPCDPENPGRFSGGVNRETFAEQLLYEVGDPANYLTPDVTADFTSLQPSFEGPRAVSVGGGRGRSATGTYKVSIAYRNGFVASGTLVLCGPAAPAKARHAGAAILGRLARAGVEPQASNVEVIGTGACAPGVLVAETDPPEVVLRVTVQDRRREVVERFTKELAPLVTSGPPGVTGYTTGRPPVREVFAYWPALVEKSVITPQVMMLGE
jgi:hypothetical protein